MRCLAKTLTLFGTIAAAGAAHAATEVITESFDYSWTQNSAPPYSTSFTLVPDSPDYQVFYDTSLGTLTSVEVQWTNVELTLNGTTKSALAAVAGSATAQTKVDGVDTGVLSVYGFNVGLHSGSDLSVDAPGNTVTQTFDAAYNPNGVFTDAAAGDTLDISWNTGTIGTLSGSSVPTSISGLIFYGIKPVADVSPSAALSGDLVVTFDYSQSAVPEPSTWAMMLAGFAGLGAAGWRAARKTVTVAA